MRKLTVLHLHLRCLHLQSLLPPKPQLPPEVERVCSILGHRRVSLPIEAALEQAQFHLTSQHLSLLLDQLSQPKEALRVFIWSVRHHPEFTPDDSVVCAILRIWTHEKTKLQLFVAVLLGARKPGFVMTPKMLTMLIQGYGWAGLVDLVVDILNKAKAVFGFDPNIWHFSCAINYSMKESRFDIAQTLLRQMQIVGCSPNQIMVDTLIKGLLAAG